MTSKTLSPALRRVSRRLKKQEKTDRQLEELQRFMAGEIAEVSTLYIRGFDDGPLYTTFYDRRAGWVKGLRDTPPEKRRSKNIETYTRRRQLNQGDVWNAAYILDGQSIFLPHFVILDDEGAQRRKEIRAWLRKNCRSWFVEDMGCWRFADVRDAVLAKTFWA